MNGRRLLLTGATGLVGRQTIGPLRALGYHVIALSRSTTPVAIADETLSADILNPEETLRAVKKAAAETLVHLAWNGSQADRWASPANLDWAAASLRLVREFADAGGRRVAAAGSCAEYDWSAGSVFSETSPIAPASLYGAAKAATGALLVAAAPALGLKLSWARMFFCYGPGEPPGRLLGDLISGLTSGLTVDCTDGLQKRDFLHAADIGRALALITDSTHEGPINVASGHAVAVRDIIETAASQLQRPELVRLGARSRPADDPACIEANVTELGKIGFQPEFDLQRGIADVIARDVIR